MIVFVEELMVRNTPQMLFLGASSATSVPAEALHCKAAVECEPEKALKLQSPQGTNPTHDSMITGCFPCFGNVWPGFFRAFLGLRGSPKQARLPRLPVGPSEGKRLLLDRIVSDLMAITA